MSTNFDFLGFRNRLSTQWLGHDFHYFEELSSTNSYVKKLDASSVEHGTIVLADSQTHGRGQYERNWVVEPGQNLTFSIVLKPKSATGIHALTLACASAIVELINNRERRPCASIKWPNDVLMNGKKVAGVLTESVFLGSNIERLILGIGINVNQKEFDGALAGKATSISLETGEQQSREEILHELLRRIEFKYYMWNRKLSPLFRKINRKIEGYGKWVHLNIDGETREEPFKLLGVNEKGMLLMLNREGGIESFSYEQIRIITD